MFAEVLRIIPETAISPSKIAKQYCGDLRRRRIHTITQTTDRGRCNSATSAINSCMSQGRGFERRSTRGSEHVENRAYSAIKPVATRDPHCLGPPQDSSRLLFEGKGSPGPPAVRVWHGSVRSVPTISTPQISEPYSQQAEVDFTLRKV